MATLAVVIERGAKRTFASAIDWPGWCRSGTDDDRAIDTLLEYRARFAPVAEAAGLRVPTSLSVQVIEVLAGNATTDFGAPAMPATVEVRPPTPVKRQRAVALVQAAWDAFDRIEADAPRDLRKGPRGGGRDTDAIREHLHESEQAYKGKLGVRGTRDLVVVRRAMLQAIADGRMPAMPKEWPSAYAARRIAWHALDHAWEIEDRSGR